MLFYAVDYTDLVLSIYDELEKGTVYDESRQGFENAKKSAGFLSVRKRPVRELISAKTARRFSGLGCRGGTRTKER